MAQRYQLGSVACVGLVVSCSYAPEFLDLCEVIFNQVVPLAHVRIVVSLHFSVRFGRNNRGCATLIKVLQEPISVEGFIRQQCSKGDLVDQRSHPLHIVRLSRQE